MQLTYSYEEFSLKLDNLQLSVDKLVLQQKIKTESTDKDKIISVFIFIADVELLLKMPVSTIRHHIEKHRLPVYGATKPLRFKKIEVLKWFDDYSTHPEKYQNKPTDVLISRKKN
jgi:hypothetical protein